MCDHRTEREKVFVNFFYQFAYLCIHRAEREREIGLVHGTMCNVHGCRWLLTRSLSTVTTALVLSWASLSSLNPCVLCALTNFEWYAILAKFIQVFCPCHSLMLSPLFERDGSLTQWSAEIIHLSSVILFWPHSNPCLFFMHLGTVTIVERLSLCRHTCSHPFVWQGILCPPGIPHPALPTTILQNNWTQYVLDDEQHSQQFWWLG